MNHLFSKVILGLVFLTLVGCSKENYIYLQRQGQNTDRQFRVKEMKGSNAVDVLWIIDNSGSMDDYQQDVIDNANQFMKDFVTQKLNWKMGLISTDESERPYIGFSGNARLDASVTNPDILFADAVDRLGTSGSGTEKTFLPILRALRDDPTFLRTSVPLAIIMVTDAEEQSGISATDFIRDLAGLTAGKNIFSYGVFASKDFGCQSDEGAWNYKGSPYEAFINSTFIGQHYPLCKNFGTSLANISHDIVTRVAHNAIYLSSLPDVSTLRVLYNNVDLPAGTVEQGGFWMYDHRLNAVIFNNLDFAKNDTDSVRVVYEENMKPGQVEKTVETP